MDGIRDLIWNPGESTIGLVCEYRAPAELVYRAHVDPDLLVQWYGQSGMPLVVELMEVRDGGRWRMSQHNDAGEGYWFGGVFHGDPSPAGMVRTFEFSMLPEAISLELSTFEEQGGITTMRQISLYKSESARDSMMPPGGEEDMRIFYARLGTFLQDLQR